MGGGKTVAVAAGGAAGTGGAGTGGMGTGGMESGGTGEVRTPKEEGTGSRDCHPLPTYRTCRAEVVI